MFSLKKNNKIEIDPIFRNSDAYGISNTDISNWNTAFGWGNHGAAGYITASSADNLTNKTGNVSMWTNDAGYLTAAITSLNGLTDATQTFSASNDTNVLLQITSLSPQHSFTMGWSGQLSVARGGTGANTAINARINLLPSYSSNTLKVLRVNAGETDVEWATVSALSDGDKGDITVSSSGTVWTIDNGVISLAKMADVATSTVFYRKTAGTGSPEVQTLATLKTDLGLTGTNSGDQTISLTGDVTGSGTGSFAATIANDSVTYAKLQNISTQYRVLGRNGAAPGDAEELSASTVMDWIGSTRGSVLYRGASGWAALTPGTSGKVLQSNGTGADPTWETVSGGGTPTIVNPAQLTAWQNNYAPTGIVPGCVIRVDSDTSYPFITGISASGFSDGQSLTIVNDGSNVFGFKNEDTNSTAANRFSMGEDAVLLPGTSCEFQYDSGASRWRLLTPSILVSEIRRGRYVGYYRTDFLQRVNDGVLSYWTSGSGAAHNLNQFNGRLGVVDHNTGTTSTGTAYLYGQDPSNPNWFMKCAAGMWFEWCYRFEDLSTVSERFGVNVGIIDSWNYDGSGDCIMFRYKDDVNSGKWELCCRSAVSETNVDSGVTVAADTWYVLRAFIHSSSRVDFWINGSFVGSVTTNIPINRDSGFGMILTKSAGSTNRITYSDYAILGQITNALG